MFDCCRPQNKNNETALHCAAQYGHTAVINLLLSHGADPSIRNVKDETALNLAAHYGRSDSDTSTTYFIFYLRGNSPRVSL